MYILNCILGLIILNHAVLASSNVTLDEIPDSYQNLTIGNSLWTSLLKNCKRPTLVCIQNNIYNYLKSALNQQNDVELTNFMKFSRNSVDYEKFKQLFDEKENKTHDEELDEQEQVSPLEQMSRSLQDNTMEFFATHDLELKLPETFFEDSVIKVSPRSVEGSGALVKMEFLPRGFESGVSQPRIFKKIRKFISGRLVYALLAILLVIKLLSVKFLFILPLVMGAAAAKKLLLKLVLFVFPALHHVFKLCPYVPHGTKHHLHKHQIAHIHHLAHGHGHGHGHGHEYGPHHGHIEVIAPHAEGPPSLHGSLHHFTDQEPEHKPFYNPHEQELEYYSGGPSFGHDLISHRHDPETNEVSGHPVGQGQSQSPYRNKHSNGRPLTPTEIENLILKAEKEALIKLQLQQEKQKIHEENLRLQQQLTKAMLIQQKLKQHAALIKGKIPLDVITPPKPPIGYEQKPPQPSPFLQTPAVSGIPSANILPSASTKLSSPQVSVIYPSGKQQINHAVERKSQVNDINAQNYKGQVSTVNENLVTNVNIPKATSKLNEVKPQQTKVQVDSKSKVSKQSALETALYQAASITYDPFYSPILEKIDKVLNDLRFTDEPCKERLICSMYKSPSKFSPHSNLVSAELSRDSKELQKPTTTNAAVIRFYRYVQAARDGQDKRDCLRLYASCSVNTER